jgi:hypothetical protein
MGSSGSGNVQDMGGGQVRFRLELVGVNNQVPSG